MRRGSHPPYPPFARGGKVGAPLRKGGKVGAPLRKGGKVGAPLRKGGKVGAPLRKGGKVGGVWSFFPPLRRGDTGGFFECLCVAPGLASRRLKIALARRDHLRQRPDDAGDDGAAEHLLADFTLALKRLQERLVGTASPVLADREVHAELIIGIFARSHLEGIGPGLDRQAALKLARFVQAEGQ